MNATEVIQEMRGHGYALRIKGDRLRIEGNTKTLTGKQLAWLKEHKGEIMVELQAEAEQQPVDAIPIPTTEQPHAQCVTAMDKPQRCRGCIWLVPYSMPPDWFHCGLARPLVAVDVCGEYQARQNLTDEALK